MSSHTQDFNINCIDRLCRVCGFRVEKRHNKGPKPKPCKSYVTTILQTFNIDIKGVSEGTQSCLICVQCHDKLINAPKRAKDVSLYISCEEKEHCQRVSQLWQPWNVDVSLEDCRSCSSFCEQKKAGRPKKRKDYTKHTSSLAPATLPVAAGSDSLFSTEQTSTDHNVNKATPMPDIPEEFCTPTKRTRTDTSRRHCPALKGMPTCSTTTRTSPSAKSCYLSEQPAPSMTSEEEKIATHALKRTVQSSFDGQTAVFKTRGQSLYINKVTKPRVPSDKAQEREEQGKQIAPEEKQQVEVLKPQEHSKFMSS